MILNIAVIAMSVSILVFVIRKTKNLFQPYEEYAVTVKCSADTLLAGLKKHCPADNLLFHSNPELFYLSQSKGGTIVLNRGQMGRRNTLRGRIHLTIRERDNQSCVAEVSVKPPDRRLFCIVWVSGFVLINMAGVLARSWAVLPSIAGLPFGFAAFFIAKAEGESELPELRHRFHALLQKAALED